MRTLSGALCVVQSRGKPDKEAPPVIRTIAEPIQHQEDTKKG